MSGTSHPSILLGTPIRKRSVVKLVLDRIEDALINKELKPGDYLPSETELTANLGVGKTSIREAIKMLEAVGVVEVRQGHGSFIREEPDEDSLSPLIFQLIMQQGTAGQLMELRQTVEPAYMQLALEKATDYELHWIAESVSIFEEKISQSTQRAEDDLEFHYRILQCTHNPFIIRIGRTVLQLFNAAVSTSVVTIPRTALKDHRNILKALEERNPGSLRTAVLQSFKEWKYSPAEARK